MIDYTLFGLSAIQTIQKIDTHLEENGPPNLAKPYIVCMTELDVDAVAAKARSGGARIDVCHNKPIFTAVLAGIMEKAKLKDPR